MREYRVINPTSGHTFGPYRAESPAGAIDACCREAGYAGAGHEDDAIAAAIQELVAIEVIPER